MHAEHSTLVRAVSDLEELCMKVAASAAVHFERLTMNQRELEKKSKLQPVGAWVERISAFLSRKGSQQGSTTGEIEQQLTELDTEYTGAKDGYARAILEIRALENPKSTHAGVMKECDRLDSRMGELDKLAEG